MIPKMFGLMLDKCELCRSNWPKNNQEWNFSTQKTIKTEKLADMFQKPNYKWLIM